jgi:hypothetical protein
VSPARAALLALGATLTLASFPGAVHAQDVAAVTSSRDGGELGPLVSLDAIDPDALDEVVKQLEIRGYDPEGTSIDLALRAFAADQKLESPDEKRWVTARTLDELGAGHAVALRWGATGPRAPELAADEVLRMNKALFDRGYSKREPRDRVDGDTVSAIRELQRETGHPVQRGDLIERRWLFILGVATEESSPKAPGTLPASLPAPPK